jgi:uncharacterized protein with HEPN domain
MYCEWFVRILAPGPDWKGYRGMGNVLRHEYHAIDDQLVWNTAKDELPPLKEAVSRALMARPKDNPSGPSLG